MKAGVRVFVEAMRACKGPPYTREVDPELFEMLREELPYGSASGMEWVTRDTYGKPAWVNIGNYRICPRGSEWLDILNPKSPL